MDNFYQRTVLAQYANSPTLLRLLSDFNEYVDPSANLDLFFSNVFDIQTAVGFGLDILGRRVGVGRVLKVSGVATYFGFAGTGAQPFNQAPFYDGPAASQNYILPDEAYRTLILVKALSNISNSSVPSYNRLLQSLFKDRGRAYAVDLGDMRMRFVFEFELMPFERSIILTSGVFPRPAAVQSTALIIDPARTFGFKGSGLQPFNQGTFLPSNQNIPIT